MLTFVECDLWKDPTSSKLLPCALSFIPVIHTYLISTPEQSLMDTEFQEGKEKWKHSET